MRVLFCIFAAIIAGFGGATVLGLGTAAVSAAVYKSEAGIGTPVAKQVQGQRPIVVGMALTGFVVGSGVVVWMFVSTRKGPESEPG